MLERQELFDVLTVQFSDVKHRRGVLALLGKMALAMAVFGVFPWRVKAQDVDSESALVKGCRLPGQKCRNKKRCCSNKCTNAGRCGCVKKGKEPLVKTPMGPVPIKALCCTNKLNKRTGECK
ncbi:MAG: hypothetical protein IT338_00455 [Thermomicrobiales bacterium]|nr:hypothetical protein [Thermomicrobiales bacterium]